jgi:hexosaminidase
MRQMWKYMGIMWRYFGILKCIGIILLAIPLKGLALPVHIIPEPVFVEERAGLFTLTPDTKIFVLTKDEGALGVVRRFAATFSTRYGRTIRIVTGAPTSLSENCFVISLESHGEIKNEEGYGIEIGPSRVSIVARAPAGLFYAFQSLWQLLSAPLTLPCARILDYPRFPYRGMHLDVSRHFFGVAFIKKYLDILASFKINTFHWHLTDSHGWRIEIKKYPRLTSVGAWRADRTGIPMTIAQPTAPGEAATYGGFYTQDQIREIVAYAKERFITIIPEIEMPGHCEAALVAYPQFADLDNPIPLLMPCGYAGDLLHNFCVGYDSSFVFLEGILDEVMQLFPSSFIHIGGDEVRPGPWLNCPRCRRRMKDNGLTTGQQLQAWFTTRIDSFIATRSRRTIGWDEITQARLSPGAAVMSWHGDAGGLSAAEKGHDAVMAPYHYTYFDFYQSDPDLEPDITYAPLFLDTVYAFDPAPERPLTGQSGSAAAHILGGEACLWTENVPTPARVEYMLLPRLLALSEALWTPPQKKDYTKFITRTEEQFRRFDAEGISYATSLYNIAIRPLFDSAKMMISVVLSDQAKKYSIHYTLDGSAVNAASPVYHQPLPITQSAGLQTALFDKDKQMGKTSHERYALHRALGASLTISPADDTVFAQAAKRLVDGIFGTLEPFDGRWVSFHDSLITITLDLKNRQAIHSVSIRWMEDSVSDIYLPRKIELSVSSDGINFEPVAHAENPVIPQQLLRHLTTTKEVIGKEARWLRLVIRNASLSADPLKNNIFLDEIEVE